MSRPSSSRKAGRSAPARLEVSIARLEEQVDQALQLGDKFDRILERVETLALNTTTLISRHDTEIKTLQSQLAGANMALNDTKKEISTLGDELKAHVSTQVASVSTAMTQQMEAVTKQMERMDARVTKLERWRFMLIGGGIALGYLASNGPSIIKMFQSFGGE